MVKQLVSSSFRPVWPYSCQMLKFYKVITKQTFESHKTPLEVLVFHGRAFQFGMLIQHRYPSSSASPGAAPTSVCPGGAGPTRADTSRSTIALSPNGRLLNVRLPGHHKVFFMGDKTEIGDFLVGFSGECRRGLPIAIERRRWHSDLKVPTHQNSSSKSACLAAGSCPASRAR